MGADANAKSERITTMMSPAEVTAIDDWAFANRIRSRGEAIRRLIEAGLSKAPSGGSAPGGSRKPTATPAPRPRKPAAPFRKALPMSKEAQIRALREQGAC